MVAQLDRYNGLITPISGQNFETIKKFGYRLTGKERIEMQHLLMAPVGQSTSNQSIAMTRKIYGDCVDPNAFKLFDPALKTG